MEGFNENADCALDLKAEPASLGPRELVVEQNQDLGSSQGLGERQKMPFAQV